MKNSEVKRYINHIIQSILYLEDVFVDLVNKLPNAHKHCTCDRPDKFSIIRCADSSKLFEEEIHNMCTKCGGDCN